MSFISSALGSAAAGVPGVQPVSSAAPSSRVAVSPTGGDEFHAMVESASPPQGALLSAFKSVGAAQASAEGALLDVVRTGNPMRMYDATAAMARFNTQTLVLTKAASKVSQAVDRLTNLQ